MGWREMMECEACKHGIGEPWDRFAQNLAGTPRKLLLKAMTTWVKRQNSYYRAGCKKHFEEANDRVDFISVMMSGLISDIRATNLGVHIDPLGKMTSTEWIEGRRRLRKEKG
jgi:hypothetical protein